MKGVKESIGLICRFALHQRAHHGRRRFRDGAAAASEPYVLDPVAVESHEDGVVITAEWVVAVDPFGIRELPVVSRIPVVIEDDLLVKLAKIRHQRKTSMTLLSPATSASASSRVLYSPNEARPVAGTLNRIITG